MQLPLLAPGGVERGRCGMRSNFRRPLEEPVYGVVPFVAEFRNTISSLPLTIIGVARAVQVLQFPVADRPENWDLCLMLYVLMAVAGLASALHHASPPSVRYKIVIDWIPILLSVVLIVVADAKGLEWTARPSFSSWFKFGLAIFDLVTDHVWLPLPPPTGHELWHYLAAFALDSLYLDIFFQTHSFRK